jgi:uncharacterized membrane protein
MRCGFNSVNVPGTAAGDTKRPGAAVVGSSAIVVVPDGSARVLFRIRPATAAPRGFHVISATRLDALSDGIFGVAMTLLVLDVRLPEDFNPADDREFLKALLALWPKFLPYALSFLVLGLRWRALVRARTAESFGDGYFWWWLVFLLLVTCVPFSTMVIGRFPNSVPAIWLYAGNTALIAVASYGMLRESPPEHGGLLRERQVSLALLLGSSLFAMAWSIVTPRFALMLFVLNVAGPALSRRLGSATPSHVDKR